MKFVTDANGAKIGPFNSVASEADHYFADGEVVIWYATLTAPHQVIDDVVVVKPTPQFSFPPLDFINTMFTAAEQAAIAQGALANAQILLWLTKATAAPAINLGDPDTINGMNALVSAGLLTQARHDRIMAGLPPQ